MMSDKGSNKGIGINQDDLMEFDFQNVENYNPAEESIFDL